MFGSRFCLCFNSNSMRNKTITRKHLVMGSHHNSSDPWILNCHYYIITTSDRVDVCMCVSSWQNVLLMTCSTNVASNPLADVCVRVCGLTFVSAISQQLWMNKCKLNAKVVDGYDLSSEYWLKVQEAGGPKRHRPLLLYVPVPQSFSLKMYLYSNFTFSVASDIIRGIWCERYF